MTADERLEQIEQRLRALESAVGRLLAKLAPEQATDPRRHLTDPAPHRRRRAPEPTTTPPAPARSGSASPWLDTEQWIGQRGLLALGVFLVILAAGYFLKLAFDRGWIAPAVRCAGGAFVGLAVAAGGWEVHRHGLKTYGAALIGCGAAIAYVAVWAAVRLYDLLPPPAGLGLLALVSLSVFAVARLITIEALAAAAALGAFLAPALLGPGGNADLLLLYAAALAAGLTFASARHWRTTTFLIALSFFTLGSVGARAAAPTNVLMYGVLGGSAGLYIGLRESWAETRLVAFFGGWLMLIQAFMHQVNGRFVVVGGIILSAPIWWRALELPGIWPLRRDGRERPVSRAETFYFYVTPVLLGWAVRQLAPGWFGRHAGMAALLVGLPYLIMGYAAVRPAFALVGTSALAAAALWTWSGVASLWALLALALCWAALDHVLDRSDGRWYAILALSLALLRLVSALPVRPPGTPAFLDHWALGVWAATLTAAILAAGLWRPESDVLAVPGRQLDDQDIVLVMPDVLWVAAGVLLLFGVTGELTRFFAHSTLGRASADLAGSLAVSTWWTLCAGGLVLLGFHRGRRAVRSAGLLVASLAVVKVLTYDLRRLDALYRVASVFVLGIVSLAVAYLYHRFAHGANATDNERGRDA